MILTDQEILDLSLKANDIRQNIIKMLAKAGSGHSAGPLGMADVFTSLYFKILNHKPEDPSWPDRDRLILSNGHICPVLYATLAEAGYFPKEELLTLRQLGSRLQGHPHRGSLPGLETTSGPLGSGLSQACGMAIGGSLNRAKWRVYVLLSDGEHDEGNTWEAVMLAAKLKLHNLTALMDRNNIQIDGFTENVMPLEPLADKYRAFGWHVLEIDGHDFTQIVTAFEEARNIFEKPTLIISHNIPGKGVTFMENNFLWHGIAPDSQDVEGAPPKGEQVKKALEDLEKIRKDLEHVK